jgi:hypothetical protein
MNIQRRADNLGHEKITALAINNRPNDEDSEVFFSRPPSYDC